MAGSVKRVPEGHHTITPHLVCRGAANAMAFYKKAFGAEEIMRMSGPDGQSIMHGEMKIGDSIFFVNDEFPGMCVSPQGLNGSPVTIHLYVEDCDAVFNRAAAAGAQPAMPLADMFWGDRYGLLIDPFGHRWSVASHIEDVSPQECMKRMAAFSAGGGGCGPK